MSEKMTCPACDSHLSSILRAFTEGRDCPSCGLPASVAWDLHRYRNRKADEELARQLGELGKEVGNLRRENRALRRALMNVRDVMMDVEVRPFSMDELGLFGE